MGGGNYEDISTHSVRSNSKLPPLSEADSRTQIESMVAIEHAQSDDQSILEQEDRRYMLLYSKSKASSAMLFSRILFKLTHMALSICYTGIHTSYCICERQYSWFHCHCPQGRRQAGTLCRLDPRELARAARSRRMGQVPQSRSCIAKRGRRRCSGRSAGETWRVIRLLRTNLCNLQSFGLSSFILLLV